MLGMRTTGIPRSGHGWFAFVLLINLFPLPAFGESRSRDAVGGLVLRGIGGNLELAWTREDETLSSTEANSRSSSNTVFEERLRLSTDGYVYHPNLLDFGTGVTLGLYQQQFDSEPGISGRASGTLMEFDVNARVLKEKRYPLSLFARRHLGFQHRSFQASAEERVQAQGLTWSLRTRLLPIRLQLSRTETETAGTDHNDPGQFYREDRLQLSAEHKAGMGGDVSFAYEFQSNLETRANLSNYDTQRIALRHVVGFGDKDRYRLNSDVTWFDQTGTIAYEYLTWREWLLMDHRTNLRSWYGLDYDSQTQGAGGAEQQSWRLSAGVRHQLYESLTSTLAASMEKSDYGAGGNRDRLAFGPGFTYRKRNPWGRLAADYAYDETREETSAVGDTRLLTRELAVFQDPDPITLDASRVDAGSIVIIRQDFGRVYELGTDYSVLRFGNNMEIRRIPTGDIADGERVWVEFSGGLGGATSTSIVSHSYGIGQYFDFGLSIYYRGNRQDETIDPDEAVRARNIRNDLFGARYTIGPFYVSAERRTEESDVPFTESRVDVGWSRRFPSRGTLSLSAGWSNATYEPPDEREVLYRNLTATYSQPLASRLMFSGQASFRNQEDSVNGSDRGLDLDLTLRWTLRQVTCLAQYEFNRYEDDLRGDTWSQLMVKVIREF